MNNFNPDNSYKIEDILANCNKASILLYGAYSKSRIALHYFAGLYSDERFNKLFNDENLIVLKNLMKFFLYRFYQINNIL